MSFKAYIVFPLIWLVWVTSSISSDLIFGLDIPSKEKLILLEGNITDTQCGGKRSDSIIVSGYNYRMYIKGPVQDSYKCKKMLIKGWKGRTVVVLVGVVSGQHNIYELTLEGSKLYSYQDSVEYTKSNLEFGATFIAVMWVLFGFLVRYEIKKSKKKLGER